MKRLLFIYNPQAGKGKIRPQLSTVIEIFTTAGFLVTVWPTQGNRDATRVSAQQGWWYDRVVCCGGDGTLSEVVAGLLTLDSPPVVGYIPAGTTNDFARNLNLPRGVEKTAAVAAAGVLRPCDMGKLNDRFFVYVAAFGAFTDVSYDTSQEFKNTFGHLAYLLEGVTRLGSLKSYTLAVEHDHGSLEGEFLFGMVSNTVSVGGFKGMPAAEVKLDDGAFEVVLIRTPKSPAELQTVLRSLAMKTQSSDGQVVAFHTAILKVTCTEELPWALDGEYGGAPKITRIQNLHNAITLVWGK